MHKHISSLLLTIIAADLSVGCGDDHVSSATTQNSSTSESDSSGGEESSGGESSSGGEAEQEPDPQPSEGWFSPCLVSEDCPANFKCIRQPGWDDGFCTGGCNDHSCVYEGRTEATLVCDDAEPDAFVRVCLLACATTAQCPLGMECRQIPGPPTQVCS